MSASAAPSSTPPEPLLVGTEAPRRERAPAEARWVTVLLGAALVSWMVVAWFLGRPPSIAPHWRQAETQSIALNFLESPNLFFPRINWGGAGPGYVEAEFAIYEMLVAAGMAASQPDESAGQLLSLVSTAGVAILIFRFAERRFGALAALAGALAFLASRPALLLGTSVMPDGMGLLCFVLGMERFDRFVETRRTSPLVLSALATALAALIKPIALGAGLGQFVWVLLARRELLRSARLWLAWTGILVVEAAQLAHGAHVYAVYGNTFGVVSGGDSKFPDLRHLVAPWVIKSTVLITLTWGLGWLGCSAAAYLTAKRRLGAVEIALVVAGSAAVLVSLRYSSSRWLGAHYHSILSVAGAWLVAAWVAAVLPWLRARRVPSRLLGLGLVGPVLVTAHCLREHRTDLALAERDPVLALGAELARAKEPADLVVVQSQEDSFDAEWNRSDNYQDPRMLYVARAKGWVLPADLKDSRALELAVAKGARWYATVGSPPAVLAPYLAKNASLRIELVEGRIYALGANRE